MVTGPPTPTLVPTAAGPIFQAIDVFATPSAAPLHGALPTDQVDAPAPRRPVPAHSADWLRLKAAGRIALVDGKIAVLDAAADPLRNPATGSTAPAAFTLDTTYSRWIIEPLGDGADAKGNRFTDQNLWNLCEAGATTTALYYWQQLTGRPDVTGAAGYFVDPYAAEGAAWPSPGPTVVRSSSGARIGTYWSGTDTVNGYTAHARGYIMYIGMAMQPPDWQSVGEAVYADANGKPLYPTIGAPRTNIQVALNWEASGHASGWADYWYASVMRFDPTAARDLHVAVTLDVGRDGVPVVVELDTQRAAELAGWRRHAAHSPLRGDRRLRQHRVAADVHLHRHVRSGLQQAGRQPGRTTPRHPPVADGRGDAGHGRLGLRLVGRAAMLASETGLVELGSR